MAWCYPKFNSRFAFGLVYLLNFTFPEVCEPIFVGDEGASQLKLRCLCPNFYLYFSGEWRIIGAQQTQILYLTPFISFLNGYFRGSTLDWLELRLLQSNVSKNESETETETEISLYLLLDLKPYPALNLKPKLSL